MTCCRIAFALLAALLASAATASDEVPSARVLFEISSEDCVSVNADGEPWDECGIQAFAMNDSGSRVLTVSARGTIQLWDGQGSEIRRIDWRDEPSGASGYPDARAVIVGNYGLAIVHQNQLLVIDVDSGEVLAQRVAADLMMIDGLRRMGPDRLFAEFKDRDWDRGAGEITLPAGDLREVPGLTDFQRLGPGYWMSGRQAPFTLHRIDALPSEISSERSCMPIDEQYCTWREIPGEQIHILDVAKGTWRSFEVGRRLDQYQAVEVVPAGATFFAIVCGRSKPAYPPISPCELLDLESKRVIHRFEAGRVRGVGSTRSDGTPEVRLDLMSGEQRESRSVSIDGEVTVASASGGAGLAAPNGGMLVPSPAGGSILVDATGRKVPHLTFAAQSCGNGWQHWTQGCRVSQDRRLWLVPTMHSRGDGTDDNARLVMYEVPGP